MDLLQQAPPTSRVPLRQTIQQIYRILGIHSQMAEAGAALIQGALLKRRSPVAVIYASIFVVIPSRSSAVTKIVLSPLKEVFRARRIETGMRPSTDRVSRASGKDVTENSVVLTTWKITSEGFIAGFLDCLISWAYRSKARFSEITASALDAGGWIEGFLYILHSVFFAACCFSSLARLSCQSRNLQCLLPVFFVLSQLRAPLLSLLTFEKSSDKKSV